MSTVRFDASGKESIANNTEQNNNNNNADNGQEANNLMDKLRQMIIEKDRKYEELLIQKTEGDRKYKQLKSKYHKIHNKHKQLNEENKKQQTLIETLEKNLTKQAKTHQIEINTLKAKIRRLKTNNNNNNNNYDDKENNDIPIKHKTNNCLKRKLNDIDSYHNNNDNEQPPKKIKIENDIVMDDQNGSMNKIETKNNGDGEDVVTLKIESLDTSQTQMPSTAIYGQQISQQMQYNQHTQYQQVAPSLYPIQQIQPIQSTMLYPSYVNNYNPYQHQYQYQQHYLQQDVYNNNIINNSNNNNNNDNVAIDIGWELSLDQTNVSSSDRYQVLSCLIYVGFWNDELVDIDKLCEESNEFGHVLKILPHPSKPPHKHAFIRFGSRSIAEKARDGLRKRMKYLKFLQKVDWGRPPKLIKQSFRFDVGIGEILKSDALKILQK